MPVKLPRYIPLSEAAHRYDLAPGALTSMVEDGKIDAVRINGGVAVAEEEIQRIRLQRENFSRLEEHPIHLSQAARKYNLAESSLSRWASSQFIRVLGKEKNRRLLNEADVAYIRAVIDAEK